MAGSSVCWDKQPFDAANSDEIVLLIEAVYKTACHDYLRKRRVHNNWRAATW